MKEGIAVKFILNGIPIPYDLSINQLRQMMESPTMKDFALACEVLSCHKSHEAYEIMKGYINDKDKYRRLYILQTIFRHPEAVELTDFLEKAISSDDLSFVNNGLLAVANYKIKVSDSLLFSVITKHLSKLSYGALTALKGRGISEENYRNLTKLFQKAEQCSQKEAIGEILFAKYLPAKAMELFDLFRRDTFAKIRLLALKIGNIYHYDISPFLSDTDGHVKKLAEAFLKDHL